MDGLMMHNFKSTSNNLLALRENLGKIMNETLRITTM